MSYDTWLTAPYDRAAANERLFEAAAEDIAEDADFEPCSDQACTRMEPCGDCIWSRAEDMAEAAAEDAAERMAEARAEARWDY